MLRSREGQMFTADMMASWVVFFLILNLALITWNVSYENRTRLIEERTMRDQVVRATDLLVRTGGYPEGWNASTVRVAGFAPRDHLLNATLLQSFADLPYTEQQTVARTQGREYRLTVTRKGGLVNVTNSSGQNLTLAYGLEPAVDAETVVVNRRSVLVNASPTPKLNQATLNLVFWQ